MIVIGRLVRSLRRHMRRVSWTAVFLAYLAHLLLTWALLALAGESKLVAPDAFPYYYMTTATTIGYGDLSPSTTAGRYIVAFLLMPGAVALFAAILTKTSASLLLFWKRHLMGKMSYDMQGHTVLVGWRGAESVRLVQLLLSDTATDDEGIVLVAEGLSENPLPDQIRYIAVPSYADGAGYQRASLPQAGRVIVHTASDDQTLVAVLAIKALKPTCHVVAHFDSTSALNLVQAHHPDVECTRPLTVEIIARAAQDPGSSLVTLDVLSASDAGTTQFSIEVPAGVQGSIGELATAFRNEGAILLGYRASGRVPPQINPPADTRIGPGATLYYLRDCRLERNRIFAAAQRVPA
ncbi:potassium channel family protein [Agrilutibacter solisilvae]|uniref:Potassium channel protein n=1 Tax=Agrilutibacter solisilvae TaxID=2763317 RepID=A0A974Y046_9GAMM|nr:potassium channel protein [Lysobacter solisilvae]